MQHVENIHFNVSDSRVIGVLQLGLCDYRLAMAPSRGSTGQIKVLPSAEAKAAACLVMHTHMRSERAKVKAYASRFGGHVAERNMCPYHIY